MAQLHLTLTVTRRWWWPWFCKVVVAYAWCIHRFVPDAHLERLADRAAAFGAKHGFKIGSR